MTGTASWAACGAMHLTGDHDGPPLAVPWPVAEEAAELARPFGLDATVLGERAAMSGLGRRGRTSCGGATRLLPALDGWVALALPRDEDLAMLPALLGVEATTAEAAWPVVADAVSARPRADLQANAGLLGVPLSVVGEFENAFAVTGDPRADVTTKRSPRPLVVDLTGLWAGPLCSHLLQRAGARVLKVEDPRRPDGARFGPAGFFDLLNAGKECVALRFDDPSEVARLRTLLAAADVVLTSARARVFEQLDLHPDDVLATASDKVWTAITSHGWTSNRVGFGDDAAAAAGLVAWHPTDGEPRFAADAIADPLCGLRAATATLDCLRRGGGWFVDASLTGAAATFGIAPVGSHLPSCAATLIEGDWSLDGTPVAPPTSRPPARTAAPIGFHTDALLAEFT